MKHLLIFSSILLLKIISAQNFNGAYLIFIGSNFTDYKNFTVNSNFSAISGTKYFDKNKPSVLFFHGWRDTSFGIIGKTISEAYLTRNDFNIIFAEWSTYASDDNYIAVVDLMSKIAPTFVQLLKQINLSGYDLTKIHFVGHSLGAHMAGRIGNLLKSENVVLSRITGLDPAGPLFTAPSTIIIFGITFTINFNPALIKGNAKFVDIIHTEAGTAGTILSTGDLDFWPNGGTIQPACLTVPPPGDKIGIGCSHRTSWRYFAESVKATKPIFLSLKCLPGPSYNKIMCKGPASASMGFYASSASEPGNYYLETRATSPYSF